MVDLVTPAFKSAARFVRTAPAPVSRAAGDGLARLAVLQSADRRRLVERNLRRADPTLSGRRLHRAVVGVFESYARYWVESFKLPTLTLEEIDGRFIPEGYEHLKAAHDAGTGAIMVLPHLGGWEWAAFWLARVRHIPITAVAERLEPPALFDWFVELRESFGMEVVALGPEAGAASIRALRSNHILALLCDRDLTGDGVEVEFFGERTTLPGGPAVLALRTGAPILPVGVYFEGDTHHARVQPPLDTGRHGSLREDVARITQDVARALEDLIRRAPEQWHLLQPNWPSDRRP